MDTIYEWYGWKNNGHIYTFQVLCYQFCWWHEKVVKNVDFHWSLSFWHFHLFTIFLSHKLLFLFLSQVMCCRYFNAFSVISCECQNVSPFLIAVNSIQTKWDTNNLESHHIYWMASYKISGVRLKYIVHMEKENKNVQESCENHEYTCTRTFWITRVH